MKFMKSLLRLLTDQMKAEEVKQLGLTVTAIQNEHLAAEKSKDGAKGKKKKGTRSTLISVSLTNGVQRPPRRRRTLRRKTLSTTTSTPLCERTRAARAAAPLEAHITTVPRIELVSHSIVHSPALLGAQP